MVYKSHQQLQRSHLYTAIGYTSGISPGSGSCQGGGGGCSIGRDERGSARESALTKIPSQLYRNSSNPLAITLRPQTVKHGPCYLTFLPRREKTLCLPSISQQRLESGKTLLCYLSRYVKYTISLLFLNSYHNPRLYNVFGRLVQTIKALALKPNTFISHSVQEALESSTCLPGRTFRTKRCPALQTQGTMLSFKML